MFLMVVNSSFIICFNIPSRIPSYTNLNLDVTSYALNFTYGSYLEPAQTYLYSLMTSPLPSIVNESSFTNNTDDSSQSSKFPLPLTYNFASGFNDDIIFDRNDWILSFNSQEISTTFFLNINNSESITFM